MTIHPVQSSPALYQSEAYSSQPSAPAPSRAAALPQDTVKLSSAAKAKAAGVSRNHDHKHDGK